MTIYTVVYVGDGVLHDVDVFTSKEEADARYNEIVAEEGGSLESLGFITEDEIGGYCQEWQVEGVHVVNGKHYVVDEADCLEIRAHDLEERKCVFIPDEEDISEKLGRPATEEEVEPSRTTIEPREDVVADYQIEAGEDYLR